MTRYWYRFGSSVVARRWQERALAELDALVDAGDLGADSEATVTLLHGLSISLLQHAETEASIAVIERALAMTERLNRLDLEARALVDLGIAHEHLCRPQEAIEVFARAEALGRASGQRTVRGARPGEHRAGLLRPRGVRRGDPPWLGGLKSRTGLGDRWAACVDRINLLAALLLGEGPDVALRGSWSGRPRSWPCATPSSPSTSSRWVPGSRRRPVSRSEQRGWPGARTRAGWR